VALPGYAVDRYRLKLGEGPEAYERAVHALRGWRQLDLEWVQLLAPATPVEVATTVLVRARHYGFWSLNPVPIVYLIAETGDVERFGFGYWTLPGHAERGEERFSVEWNSEDGSVRYDVFASPLRNTPWPKLGYPLARALQRRFARDSRRAMLIAAGA
jgi:uncharacterized protein (UPF0548 family)